MDYRLLGRTGLRVSPLCLGTMNFGMARSGGVQTEEADGHRIMDRGLELGINFFDTANVYGDGRGLTEQIIGRWFAQGGGRREQTVLATKVYDATGRVAEQRPALGARTSAAPARTACGACRPTTSTSTRCTTSTATRRGTRSGRRWTCSCSRARCSTSGSSNFAGWHIVQANEARQAPRLARPRVGAEPLQPQRPHDRARGAARVRALRRRHDPVEPARWRPARRRARRTRGRRRRGGRAVQERIEEHCARSSRQWEKFCAELGEQPADVALAWLLANPVVTAPIIGPRTVEQLDGAMRRARRRARRRRARRVSTRSSPAPAVPRPKRTHGDRDDTW